MRRRIALAGALALGCASLACTWVKLTAGGTAVRVAKEGEVSRCETKGRTHAQTTDRAWMFGRNPKTIAQELESLARNEAALMGGDTIVPASAIEAGRQTFDVYLCAK